MSDGTEQHGRDSILLARIDERTTHISSELKTLRDEFELYVTKVEFAPVRLIVFGIVTLILTGFVGGLIALVMSVKHVP